MPVNPFRRYGTREEAEFYQVMVEISDKLSKIIDLLEKQGQVMPG